MNWTTILIGAAIGYVGGKVVRSPVLGTVVGAGAGYFYGGGTLAQLGAQVSAALNGAATSSNPDGSTTAPLTIPTITVTGNP